MKNLKVLLTLVIIVFASNTSQAQDGGISKSLGLYVFPSNNQDKATQEADEMDCFNWAKEQSGYDPINPTKYVGEEVDTSLDGSAVKGAARGAAAGAAIGAIAGDTGEGAAIGAVVGGLRGRRAKKMSEHQQKQANNNAAEAASNAAAADYNKAFSACMEGKGYTVK